MKSDKLILGLAILAMVILYTAFVFGFLTSEEQESRTIYLAAVGIPVVAILLIFPRVALVFLAVYMYWIRWLYDTWAILPREITWLADGLVILLVLRTLIMYPTQHERLIPVEWIVLGTLGFAVMSAVINGTGPMTFVVGIRLAFRYVLLMIAAYHIISTPVWFRRYLIFLFVTAMIQTPVIVWEWQGMELYDPDRLSGTFGWGMTPAIGFFMLMLVAYLAARVFEFGRIRMSYIFIFLWIAIGPFLGEVKFYFLLMPVMLAFMARTELLKRPVLAVAVLVMGALLFVGTDYLVRSTGYWLEGRNPLTFISKVPEAFQREMELGEAGSQERSYMYVYSLRHAAASPKFALFGHGPGSITDSFISGSHSSWLDYFERWGLKASRTVSFFWLLLEYGYVGVVLFLFILWKVFRRGAILRASTDPTMRVYGRLLETMTFTYTAYMFYITSWQTENTSFTYWAMAGLLIRLSYQEEARQKATAEAARAAIPEPAWQRKLTSAH